MAFLELSYESSEHITSLMSLWGFDILVVHLILQNKKFLKGRTHVTVIRVNNLDIESVLITCLLSK